MGKFLKNLLWGPVRSHTKYGPDLFCLFDVYWTQTNKQTDKQSIIRCSTKNGRKLYGNCSVRFFLHSGFIVGRKWIISVLYHLINHQNTELNAETKEHAWNHYIFRNFGRLYSIILCLYSIILCLYSNNLCLYSIILCLYSIILCLYSIICVRVYVL